ncbi:hypothetical protein AVL62_13370 [Serinicoccus chungangensis]|uniref:Polyketide antibiotic transporter n=1 Tax=Serinicoccus chungangensis TaxID=767452 RepID=A0A0W8IBU2_9MICO|nr:hypothetical protein [Serinicoccus chungangensis]KUG57411.1 hypothetical protein AVL62_13370 [Serinicoccus chungangensis]
MSATTGVGTMTGIALRTGWRSLLAWVVGLAAVMVLTGSSISALYDTPEKVAGYAESLGGDALAVINGRVAGLDTLGGVLANEFGFVLSFAVPVMAIALTTRHTRREEETGRLELLLAARIGRHAPLAAAVLLVSAATVVTGAAVGAAMVPFGADPAGALRYGLAVAGLGLAFVGITAVAAQGVEHARAVWGIGLALTLVSFLLRGLGALREGALVWASPHGWVDEVRAFGEDARWWPLALPVLLWAGLVALAVALRSRRDVGGALLRPRRTHARASASLQTSLGLAWHQQRAVVAGWALGAAALMAVFGSLAQEIVDAVLDNPALGAFLGAGPEAQARAADLVLAPMMSTFLVMLALLVTAYVLVGVGSWRREEESGRLEVALSAPRPRSAWLGPRLLVVTVGALMVGAVGALALGAGAAASLGDDAWLGDVTGAAAAQLPAVLVFLGLGTALVGWLPRAAVAGWGVFALAAALAYLGPGLDLPSWLLDATPFLAVGQDVVGEGPQPAALAVLTVLGLVLLASGFVGLRRRDVPAG